MLTITQATEEHLPIIRDIAYRTWPDTFGAILSPEQIHYMLEMMYSLNALREQIHEQGHGFLLAKESESDDYLGYVSYEPDYKGQPTTKIHKLYTLPASQGKGVGRLLIEDVAEVARQRGNDRLSLNVNRNNRAVGFYERLGFYVAGEENIDIGNGFLMEDYVMQKLLSS